MTDRRYYFAYGSNMDKKHLDKWCKRNGRSKVEFLSTSPAKLSGYELKFNHFSTNRKAGTANIMESENDCVYGLLIEIKEEGLEIIRRKEGCPDTYKEICVNVEKFDGTTVPNVKTYKVVGGKEKSNLQPSTKEYMELLIKNAKKYCFPNEYVKFLESIETKDCR